jgi:hypothetical protein
MSVADGDIITARDRATVASVRARDSASSSVPTGLLPRPYQAEAALLGAAALRRRGNTLQAADGRRQDGRGRFCGARMRIDAASVDEHDAA